MDGTVVPCCLDGEGIINLGNIHKTNFSEIVESKRANNIFNGFSRREVLKNYAESVDIEKGSTTFKNIMD